MRQKLQKGGFCPAHLAADVKPGRTFTLIPDGVVMMRLASNSPSYPAGMKDPNEVYPPRRFSDLSELVPAVTIGTGRLIYLLPEKEVLPVESEVSIASRWGTPNVKEHA